MFYLIITVISSRLSISEHEEPKKSIIETDDKESTESKTSDVDDHDENLSPKNKRMKHDEDESEETIKKTGKLILI